VFLVLILSVRILIYFSIKSSKLHSQQVHGMSSTKPSDSSTLFNELTKMMCINDQQQPSMKHKQAVPSTSSIPSTKRQKLSDTSMSTSLSIEHQQLLWQMTQQFLMPTQTMDIDSSSLLKQQLLGLTPPVVPAQPKRVGRPPKQSSHPQVMRSSTNMNPAISHSSTNSISSSAFERTNFTPRRRGRPPKYVTERGGMSGLASPHDLDQSSYDQLFAAIENSVMGTAGRTSSAAFQSALASMLGQHGGLSLPTSLSQPPSSMSNTRK
jgi:hypothetical protein